MSTSLNSTGLSRAGEVAGPAFDEEVPSHRRLTQVCLMYVGLTTVVPQYVGIRAGPISAGLLISGLLAVSGWRDKQRIAEISPYLFLAALLGGWTLVSALASWDTTAVYEAAIYGTWVLLLVPGLAVLLSHRRYRNAMVVGWAAGAAVYGVTALYRQLVGRAVFDSTGGGSAYILGENRNAVNLMVLVVIPLLLAGDGGGRLFRYLRWPVAAVVAWWMVQSGGRAGLLGLGVMILALAVLQPGMTRRAGRLLLLMLVGFVAFALLESTGGQAFESTNRLLGFFSGERTDADKARELLLRKAGNLALENPAFGVGFNRFRKVDHPVIDQAERPRIRQIALTGGEHNTFASVMAESGFPGLFAFGGLCLLLLAAGVRHLRSIPARASTAALAGLIVTLFFQNQNGPRLFLPFALVLSAVLMSVHDQRRHHGVVPG